MVKSNLGNTSTTGVHACVDRCQGRTRNSKYALAGLFTLNIASIIGDWQGMGLVVYAAALAGLSGT